MCWIYGFVVISGNTFESLEKFDLPLTQRTHTHLQFELNWQQNVFSQGDTKQT